MQAVVKVFTYILTKSSVICSVCQRGVVCMVILKSFLNLQLSIDNLAVFRIYCTAGAQCHEWLICVIFRPVQPCQ